MSSKWKLGAYMDEIDKYRGHDMQSKYDPETAAVQWFSPAYHTNQAKLTGTLTPRLLVEGGFSSNLEYYTNSYQEGIEQPRGTAAWYANTNQTESDLGGWKRAAQVQNTQSPARFNWQAAVSYVTGAHNLKTGFQYQRGTFYHTYDANGDLYAGGAFTRFPNANRRNLALISAGDGSVRDWNALADGPVLSLTVDGWMLYAAGAFGSIGDLPRYGIAAIQGGVTSVSGEVATTAWARMGPNPTAGPLEIEFVLPAAADIKIAVFDIQGRKVALVGDGRRPAGRNSARWAGTIEGRRAPAGVYLVRLQAGNRSWTKRVVILR